MTFLRHQYNLSLVASHCEMQRAFWAEPIAVFREAFSDGVDGRQEIEHALPEMELPSTSGIGTVGYHGSLQVVRPQRAEDPRLG